MELNEMKITGQLDYSKPDTASGCWELEYEQECDGEPIEDLVLMRSNRRHANGLKQMISTLDSCSFESDAGINDLRLILSAPKMYEALAAVHRFLQTKIAWSEVLEPIKKPVEDALLAAEQFVIPWEDE